MSKSDLHDDECANPRECRAQAEAEMFSSGIYDPIGDPLFDHTAPPYNPAPNYHLAGGVWVRSDPMEGQR